MKKASVLLSLALFSCVTKKELPKEPITLQVRSGQWVSCWELCGKGDSLIAITETHCVCRKGKSFLHGFKLIKEPKDQPENEPKEQKSILEFLGTLP